MVLGHCRQGQEVEAKVPGRLFITLQVTLYILLNIPSKGIYNCLEERFQNSQVQGYNQMFQEKVPREGCILKRSKQGVK